MHRWSFYFFPGTFLLLVILALLSRGVYDPGDGVMHYLIAHYAPQHPALLLDHWGKPLYTLLSLPFAQFGYNGSVIFNLLCLCTSGWLAWKTALQLKIPNAWLAAPLSIFAPIALPVGMSGLTEPLFALVLIAGVFLAVKGRFGLAAIVISFLPFVRTEGFFLAPFFALFFLLRRDLISIALLATGTLLYSLAGFFVLHDFLWIIHQNPYKGEKLYGHGGLFDFITVNEFTWGWGLTLLLVLGMIAYIFRRRFAAKIGPAEALLVMGCFLGFLVMHSVFWWKGLFGSLGLHRVMACTIPPAALIGLRGLQLVSAYLPNRKLQIGFVSLLLAVQVFLTYRQHPLPLQPTKQEQTMRDAAQWLEQNRFSTNRIYSANPFIAFAAHRDPYDNRQFVAFRCTCPDVQFENGDLIVWESHFAQFGLPFPIQLLEQDPRFKKLEQFGEIPATQEEEKRKFGLAIFAYQGQ